jgi:hypothetical protein
MRLGALGEDELDSTVEAMNKHVAFVGLSSFCVPCKEHELR